MEHMASPSSSSAQRDQRLLERQPLNRNGLDGSVARMASVQCHAPPIPDQIPDQIYSGFLAIQINPRSQHARAKQHHQRQDQYRRLKHRNPLHVEEHRSAPLTPPLSAPFPKQPAPRNQPPATKIPPGSNSGPHHLRPGSRSQMKRPPGNRVASSLGRIVPTEAKPSELSGEILSLAKTRVKD
jgi:hypothetical protein